MKLHGHDIEVGDKVWHITKGEGEVEQLDEIGLPYLIRFIDLDCHWHDKKELFWQPFDIPAHAYQKPKKLVERGIVVLKRKDGLYDCTVTKITKLAFEKHFSHLTFIRFVEETVEMVEE